MKLAPANLVVVVFQGQGRAQVRDVGEMEYLSSCGDCDWL